MTNGLLAKHGAVTSMETNNHSGRCSKGCGGGRKTEGWGIDDVVSRTAVNGVGCGYRETMQSGQRSVGVRSHERVLGLRFSLCVTNIYIQTYHKEHEECSHVCCMSEVTRFMLQSTICHQRQVTWPMDQCDIALGDHMLPFIANLHPPRQETISIPFINTDTKITFRHVKEVLLPLTEQSTHGHMVGPIWLKPYPLYFLQHQL